MAPPFLRMVSEAWRFARERFPAGNGVVPEVILTPDMDSFRRITSRPGWEAASTTRSTVVLEPLPVLAVHEVPLATTLRHELLHVAVESRAGTHTPLWLREGVVEVLAGEGSEDAPQLPVVEMERWLHHADSREQSEAAHRAAAARTRELVERYGMSAVRGWGGSGAVPGAGPTR